MPDHPKVLRLLKRVGPSATDYLLRLWIHCELDCRGEFWPRADPEYIEYVCRYRGRAGKLYAGLLECGFIVEEAGGIRIHNWESYNSHLVQCWRNGTKGGRPPGSGGKPGRGPGSPPVLPNATGPKPRDNREITEPKPRDNRTKTEGEPTDNPCSVVLCSVVKNTPSDPPKGGGEPGNPDIEGPPVLVTDLMARAWWEGMQKNGAAYTEADFLEAYRLLHSTRDAVTGNWRFGRRGIVSDPRSALEQRMAESNERRLGREAQSNGRDKARVMYVLQVKIKALEERLEEHKGRPGSAWPAYVIEDNRAEYLELRKQLETLKLELTHG